MATTNPIDLYDNVYGDFASQAEAAVRRETYGLGRATFVPLRLPSREPGGDLEEVRDE